jgi:DNA mismatch repair protein MutS2
MIYPQNFEQKIGFAQIRQILSEACLSQLGQEHVEGMSFTDKKNEIEESLDQTIEFIRILQEEDTFPNQFFFDVRSSLKKIRIEGLYLDESELFDLRRSLNTINRIVAFLVKENDDEKESTYPYPHLRLLAADILTFPKLEMQIDSMLDKYGKMKDNASSTLMQIRREMTSTTNSISRTLNNILRNAQSEGLVDKDTAPAMRDGRLVIPVAPGLKRKIKGIVHDESASGKTVFIEPEQIVEANNRIRELESEERREIIRILVEFSSLLRPQIYDILVSYQFLAEIDFIRAKAQLAIRIKGIKPIIEDKQVIDWGQAVHPLLQLSLAKHDKKVIPLDIQLDQDHRILIISGPNAGGKSVCLKTVGLLQYMLQCGLLIPLHERSCTGVFSSIFIDIGDEQSIEDDLSTYSSHLLNMKNMMKGCNDRSLILIDEFGGGTEPQIGGAIAEAVLRQFNEKKTFGVITTHYQNLKHFAEDHKGVINGAMLYDRHQMLPLFQLQIGNPGSSFAIEIARKIGLPESVIADATDMVGIEYINADKYLQDIVRDKVYWESKRKNIHKREKEMEQTIARYQIEIDDIMRNRKEIIRTAKEEAEQILHDSNAKIENTIRSIKESQAEKGITRQARQDLADFKVKIEQNKKDALEEKIAEKMEKLRLKQDRKKENKKKEAPLVAVISKVLPLAVGDNVVIKGQTSVGTLTNINNGKNAVVTFGMMKTQIKLDRLERTQRTIKKEENIKSTFISSQTQDEIYEKRLNFRQDIDVRGMRGDEAIQAVTYFIDDAILVGMSRVRILHGTGTGILRILIRDYLKTISGVKNFQDEHVQLGGIGITVVDLI